MTRYCKILLTLAFAISAHCGTASATNPPHFFCSKETGVCALGEITPQQLTWPVGRLKTVTLRAYCPNTHFWGTDAPKFNVRHKSKSITCVYAVGNPSFLKNAHALVRCTNWSSVHTNHVTVQSIHCDP